MDPAMRKLITTQDGSHSLFSETFGVSYHSKFGAIQETQHVFIDAALRFKAVIQRKIKILEVGFGTGLNAFMTLLEAHKRNLLVEYIAVEAFPITMEQVDTLNYTEKMGNDEEAAMFQQMHQCEWGTPVDLSDNFKFQKLKQQFEDIDHQNAFDIIYFDAFAPNAQPHLWEEPLLRAMYDALKPEGILTTYCAKGIVKRRLKSIGFEVEALPGPPGKREMTRALK